ncbi:MAG: serine hydrolase domain-containing protein, partial [Armatimonadota bacterium]
MKTFNSLLITALLLGSATSCASPTSAPAHSVPVAANLIEQLVAALNSKDGSGLEPFLKEHASSAVPVADRLERMKGLAEQGAPFKIVKMIPSGPSELKALITDKGGMELGLKMTLTKDAEPKMDRLLAGPPDLLESAPTKSYANWSSLQSLADSICGDVKSPAMGIAVIRDGKMEKSVSGVREQGKTDKVSLDEPWSIGSIGKPLCSTVIGSLIESGKLKWDTTLGEVLGDLPMKPGYKDVTIEQIMHHRGGVPEDPGMRRPDVLRIVAGETDSVKIRQNYAKDILGRDLIAKPGQRFAYSNAGYALLGAIAEKVTGKQYEKLVR